MLPYHDLLLLIFEYLSNDTTSLLRLCHVNRKTYAASTQILYKTVVLHALSSVDLFCSTVVGGSHDRHPLIQSLWIGPAAHDRCPGIVALVPRIRAMLQLLPCLRHLTLTPMAKSFGQLFNGLASCVFTLESLTVSYHTQPSFARFLQSQPSITRLQLFDPDTEPPRAYNLLSSINELSVIEPVLPNLEYVSADPRVLTSVLVGRPIMHVDIAVGACLSNEHDELKKLVTALTQTSVPISSITHTLRTVRIHLWGNRFLQRIKETHIRSSLRNLTICLPQIMRPVFLLRTSAQIRPIAHISQLFAKEMHEFNNLETFELSLDGFRLSDPSAEEVAESFGSTGKLKTWQSYCGTLQRVVLYGTELES